MKRCEYNESWISFIGACSIILVLLITWLLGSELTKDECLLMIILAAGVFLISFWLNSKYKLPYSMKIENEMLVIEGQNFTYYFSKEALEFLPLDKGRKIIIRGAGEEHVLDSNKRAIRFLEKFKNS